MSPAESPQFVPGRNAMDFAGGFAGQPPTTVPPPQLFRDGRWRYGEGRAQDTVPGAGGAGRASGAPRWASTAPARDEWQ